MRVFHLIGSLRRARSVAIAAAMLLVLAQSLSAAHYHPLPATGISATSAVGDGGACSLCLLAFHSPTVSAPPLTLTIGADAHGVPPQAAAIELRGGFDSHLFGRAPPAFV